MRRPNWLLIIVLLGVLASGTQLAYKAQLEPFARQVGLAVASEEIIDASWWPALQAAGVRFAVVTEPEQIALLPAGVQPVIEVNPESWPQWRALSLAPAAFMFSNNQFTEEIAEEVRAREVPVGILEFRPPADFAADPTSWEGYLLRVYNQPAHPFIDEYTIAVRERQVGLVVVRLDPIGNPPLGVEHVEQVSAALATDGHTFATSLHPREVVATFGWVFWVQALALGALAAWGLGLVLDEHWRRVLVFLPVLAVLAIWALEPFIGLWRTRQLVALAAALAYPGAGIIWWLKGSGPAGTKGHSSSCPLRGALYDFAALTAFCLAGGLAIHATLSHFAFHLNILQFMGVKLAYALPLGLAGLLILVHWLRYGLGAGLRLRHRYLRWLVLAIALVVFLLAVYVLLNRTGNQSRVRILPIELEFRQWLYRTFWVRPRTKEFLGYPILLVGLYLWRRQVRLLGGPAVLLGLIAQLSLVNTFEHLHHPILLSLIRSGLGLAIGVTLGLIGLAVMHVILPAREGW